MYREIGLLLAAAGLGWLIVFKTDQQIVRLLQGKLFKQKRDMKLGPEAYKRHVSNRAAVAAITGLVALALAIILFENGASILLVFITTFIGTVLFGWGGFNRVSSFLAADRELGENVRASNDTNSD